MENEILTKLKKIFEKPIGEESQVVYIMVQIRKLLDRTDANLKYSLLWFYCSWVLHPKMNRLSVVRDILNKIAEEHRKKGINQANLDFINFIHLRKEMKEFFQEKNLPMDVFKKEKNWRKFRELLISVIQGCPLETKSKLKLIYVEKFSFKKCEENEHNGFKNFNVEWEYKLVDEGTIFGGSSTEIILP